MTDYPKHPLQAMMDGMSEAWQQERASSQMTLGKLITALGLLPAATPVVGFGTPFSFRGYYCDLAFQPCQDQTTAGELLAVCQGCMGRHFEGYKGGEYLMGERTPIWIASYGTTCGAMRLMGLSLVGGSVRPEVCKEES